MGRFLDQGRRTLVREMRASDLGDPYRHLADPAPSRHRPRTCGGGGEMEIGTGRDSFGQYDTEVYACPGCPDCEGGAR
jgi:hypothetical protein